ncbi:lyase family protein [Myceligenerans pegani]|uniref:Adenylosuccinate lyase n=1 Tax=Myceligenerans pegani TaxID=2776917 RepID=A0ABR9N5U4_9MICO|nr:lyase family protein [Myceligenerans sp. TRM 65318]MBE1879013.1 adenylosuccinate lyase [Myceligenerans sp. TRM 65318]MBE3021284.1 adenylosuccinate lyase [Myceligenerans sp. TRM 65318]
MAEHGLLLPGADTAPGNRAGAATDDVAVLAAMLTAEREWTRALEDVGAAPPGAHDAVARAAEALWGASVDARNPTSRDSATVRDLVVEVAREAGRTGNPVVPLVERLRRAVTTEALRSVVHTGLTSQDVVDTALMSVIRDAAALAHADLRRVRTALASLAVRYRDTPALARTLAQPAVPTTFGARAATWLQGVAEADDRLLAEAAALPVAYGGAAGTLDKVPHGGGARGDGAHGTGAFVVVQTWADNLGLAVPAAPWHVTRYPVTRAAGALAEVCGALGKLAADVLTGVRDAELAEPAAPGRGASSTMPHKRNPVLSILLRRSAIAAPHALAQVATAAALAVDERPDGAWHAEWPALRDLARHTSASAALAADLAEGLAFDQAAALRNLRDALGAAGATGPAGTRDGSNTRGENGKAAWDTGDAALIVDRVLSRYARVPPV